MVMVATSFVSGPFGICPVAWCLWFSYSYQHALAHAVRAFHTFHWWLVFGGWRLLSSGARGGDFRNGDFRRYYRYPTIWLLSVVELKFAFEALKSNMEFTAWLNTEFAVCLPCPCIACLNTVPMLPPMKPLAFIAVPTGPRYRAMALAAPENPTTIILPS
jgi:hypothetical protein